MTLTSGSALAGRLAKAAMDRNVPVRLPSPVRQLVTEHDGVAGALVAREGKTVFVRAKHGVVPACGGFPHDIERRKQLFPHAPTGREHHCPQASTRDGLRVPVRRRQWCTPARASRGRSRGCCAITRLLRSYGLGCVAHAPYYAISLVIGDIGPSPVSSPTQTPGSSLPRASP
jgi:hypothetical protein